MQHWYSLPGLAIGIMAFFAAVITLVEKRGMSVVLGLAFCGDAVIFRDLISYFDDMTMAVVGVNDEAGS